MLYKYSWRKVGEVADNFVHSGKFQKVAASTLWICFRQLEIPKNRIYGIINCPVR